MTTALWILLIFALLLCAVNLLRVGVDAEYDGETFFLRAKAGPVTLTLLPKKPKQKPEKPPKPEKKPKKTKKPEKEKKPLTLPSLSALLRIARLALEAVGTFRRKLNVDLLRLYLRIGTDDPYSTAMTYARVRAALDGLYPLAARTLTIRERDVRLTPDFTGEKTSAAGRLKLTIRIGQIVGIALVLAWKVLWVLLRDQKKKKSNQTKAKHRAAANAAERTASNG